MAKSSKQQVHQERLSEEKRSKTKRIAEETCRFAVSNHEYSASNRRLSEISKLVDPEGKGLSNATFSSSHVQEILVAYGIGRFAGLQNEGIIDAGKYLESQRELFKRDKEIVKLKEKIKKLNKEIRELTLNNEVLRHDNMGLLTTINTSGAIVAINNIGHK